MTIPTESIGSIPRPTELLHAPSDHAAGRLGDAQLAEIQKKAVADTIQRLEATGSPVVTDGEQSKPSFATYPLVGLTNLSAEGVVLPFADGHQRQLPSLTAGPFRYHVHAEQYLRAAQQQAQKPVKQAVIAPSALSMLYPVDGIKGYSREKFLEDVVSLKLDPSGGLLKEFIALNNRVLDRFNDAERARIGVHCCPGGDLDSTHSLDVDYAGLLPTFFQLNAGNFYLQMASEAEPDRALSIIAENLRPDARVFVGVVDPIDPRVETAEEVRDRVLAAACHIPVDKLGTCDDCGFSPFADDTSTSRDIAFAKIAARTGHSAGRGGYGGVTATTAGRY